MRSSSHLGDHSVPSKRSEEHANQDRSRGSRRAFATRDRLLRAARDLFAEKGLDSVRIDEITDRADLGKGTFYYHFRNRQRIIREVIRTVIDELVTVLEERCEESVGLPALLDSLIAAHLAFFANRWQDFVLYFQGRSDLILEGGYEGLETPYMRYIECVERMLARATRRHFTQPVLRRLTCAVVGFVSGYYSFAAIASQDENVDEVFSSLRNAIVVSLTRFAQEAALVPEEQNLDGKEE